MRRVGEHERILPGRAADAHQAEGFRVVHLARGDDDAAAGPQQALEPLRDQEVGQEVDGEGQLQPVGRGHIAGDHLHGGIEGERIDALPPEQPDRLVAGRIDGGKAGQVDCRHRQPRVGARQGLQGFDPRRGAGDEHDAPVGALTQQSLHNAAADAARSAGHDELLAGGARAQAAVHRPWVAVTCHAFFLR
jgi:hypothetical protein